MCLGNIMQKKQRRRLRGPAWNNHRGFLSRSHKMKTVSRVRYHSCEKGEGHLPVFLCMCMVLLWTYAPLQVREHTQPVTGNTICLWEGK